MPKRKAAPDTGGTMARKVRYKMDEAPINESDIVVIIVGTGRESKTFTAFANRLTTNSEFFKAALTGAWEEASRREVKLPEDDPEVFGIFNNFIQSGKVYSAKDGDVTEDCNVPGWVIDAETSRLNKAWRLGQKLLSTSFKDAVTDVMEAKGRGSPHLAVLFYKHSVQTSSIRKLFVEQAVWEWKISTLQHHSPSETMSDFLTDVAIGFMVRLEGKQKNPLTTRPDKCRHHEHVAEGKQCWQDMKF